MSFGSRAPFGAAGGTETLSQTPRTVAGKRWDKGRMERGEGEQGEKGGRGRTLKQRREGEKAPKRCTHKFSTRRPSVWIPQPLNLAYSTEWC